MQVQIILRQTLRTTLRVNEVTLKMNILLVYLIL